MLSKYYLHRLPGPIYIDSINFRPVYTYVLSPLLSPSSFQFWWRAFFDDFFPEVYWQWVVWFTCLFVCFARTAFGFHGICFIMPFFLANIRPTFFLFRTAFFSLSLSSYLRPISCILKISCVRVCVCVCVRACVRNSVCCLFVLEFHIRTAIIGIFVEKWEIKKKRVEKWQANTQQRLEKEIGQKREKWPRMENWDEWHTQRIGWNG